MCTHAADRQEASDDCVLPPADRLVFDDVSAARDRLAGLAEVENRLVQQCAALCVLCYLTFSMLPSPPSMPMVLIVPAFSNRAPLSCRIGEVRLGSGALLGHGYR